MNNGAKRYCAKRESVTRLDICLRSADYRIADLEVQRCQNVSLFPVYVMKKGYSSAAIRIVLDTCNFCRYTGLFTTEVNNAILLLMTTTDMTGS